MNKLVNASYGFGVVMIATLLNTVTPFVVSGANYYVDSVAGRDTNAGTSSTTAWKTFNNPNAGYFYPGDSLNFKRGSVWNQELTPQGSGDHSAGIWNTIRAYGTGAKPRITGVPYMVNILSQETVSLNPGLTRFPYRFLLCHLPG